MGGLNADEHVERRTRDAPVGVAVLPPFDVKLRAAKSRLVVQRNMQQPQKPTVKTCDTDVDTVTA